jgi:hypothetical protein
MLERLEEPYYENPPESMMEFQKILKEILGDRKYFFLIDVPDSLSKKNLDDFVNTIEFLIGVHNVSIIIAMNISHYEKSFSYSEVLGKFHPQFIKLFSVEDTEELVRRRLTNVSVKPDGITPFTEDSIKIIHSISGGIPRLILTKCDKLFTTAINEEASIIDNNFAEKILKNSHVIDTLNQRINDPVIRQSLLNVFNVLKIDLGGKAESQKDYINKVKQKGIYDNHVTIIKKIKQLERLRLITIMRDEQDMKSKIIRCVI